MNGNHWTDFSEAQLAAIKRDAPIQASRRGHRVVSARPPAPAATAVAAEPAYPPQWLPEVQARIKAQTPAEWMRDNGPDPHEHRNGTAPAGTPSAEAYPREWLQGLDPPRGVGLGGEGWINWKAA